MRGWLRALGLGADGPGQWRRAEPIAADRRDSALGQERCDSGNGDGVWVSSSKGERVEALLLLLLRGGKVR